MACFEFEGQRIAYTEYGGGPAAVTAAGARGRTARSSPAASRPVILVHGLLLSQEMHRPLAEDLAARGNRVITVDLLGHGQSDRPRDMWRYSMRFFGDQVVALMDHLQIDEAVVMGTSLGANTALKVALTRARAAARHGDRDAGARQRAAVERAGVHAAAGRADVRRAGDEARRRVRRARCRGGCCRTTAT